MRIGIDVGGTNTDAVLIDGGTVLAAVKSATTQDVTSGIVQVLRELGAQRRFDPAEVTAVMIGTTHFINAITEASRLAPTAAVRLGLPATAALPPFCDWPQRLVAAVDGKAYMCHGGHEFDGSVISTIDRNELRRAAEDMGERGVRSVAISSVFSPVNAGMEQEAAAIISEQLPDVHISLSHEIGRMGLLERENATIINACLRELAEQICDGLAAALTGEGFSATLYLSQNDGTLMDVEYARRYPVATFASGPTNSMRGAAFLSGLQSCAVVDVGGTTTDVGILNGGFPREATAEVSVGGVRTNFRMPDVLSVGIGGGSRVRGGDSGVTVGPDSVGYWLRDEALIFGGSTLTASDLAVAAGLAQIGDPSTVAGLDRSLVAEGLAHIVRETARVVDRMRTSAAPLPVVLVGGGSILLPDELPGVEEVHRPGQFAVANAIGAAIAQVGGEVDRIFSINPGQRDSVLDEAKDEAIRRATAAGANPGTVQVVDVEEVPIAYLPGNATRIRVRAVGDLTLDPARRARTPEPAGAARVGEGS
ncbi:hydantoinase/oxoprolinase N-terminal domain-containing protein [Pseudonocardia asaccharolytica]|uniref:Hydantoinase n=1 Tax=Pseudonocardia asaccharolytica DSM 44247 = NBRC 16224 TaxID=1123024 RepID=A0A511D9X1_9PSEU|nr:hydantoinase/oxoprolinase family protein [Pseudonocardia asaccharolytica]GEL19748.1 hydantoinase [Pseudonocardia asaccharolytica DSM 44247 = NBRC 16224]